jgi:hypothetical protein
MREHSYVDGILACKRHQESIPAKLTGIAGTGRIIGEIISLDHHCVAQSL